MIKNKEINPSSRMIRSLSIISIFFLMLTINSSCSKLDIAEGSSKRVENKIKDFNKSSLCSDASVKEFTFQEKTVYLFDSGTCGNDMTSEVTDSEANSLGFLGGISGNTKINGEEFSNAIFIKTIWSK